MYNHYFEEDGMRKATQITVDELLNPKYINERFYVIQAYENYMPNLKECKLQTIVSETQNNKEYIKILEFEILDRKYFWSKKTLVIPLQDLNRYTYHHIQDVDV